MHKVLILTLTLFFSNSLFANKALREFLLKHNLDTNGNKILLIVNTNDCVNCYKPLNLFVKNLKDSNFKDVYLVFTSIYERQINLYTSKIFESDFQFKKIIIDDEFCSKIGFNSFTSAYYLNGNDMLFSQTIKNDWELKLNLFSSIKISQLEYKKDSIDISDHVLGNFLEIGVLSDTLSIIFDKDQGCLIQLNPKSKKIRKKLFLKQILESKLKDNLNFLTNDTSTYNFNLKISKQIPSLKENIYLVNLNCIDNKIFLGYRIVNRVSSDKGIRVFYLPIIAVFDSDLNLDCHHYIPQYMPDGSYLDVLFLQLISKEKIKLQFTDGRRFNDTLAATFKLVKNNYCTLLENLKIKLPDDLPKTGRISKLPIYYKVNVCYRNEIPVNYYFCERERLYYFNGNDFINYSINKSLSDSTIYHSIINFNFSSILSIYTINKDQYLIEYDIVNNKLKNKLLLNNYVLNDFRFFGNKLHGIKSWPRGTYYYTYSLNLK